MKIPTLFLALAALLPAAWADSAAAPTELRVSEVAQRHVLGGKPLAPFPESPRKFTLHVDDEAMGYRLFSEVLRTLVSRGADVSLAYHGRVCELHINEALHRAHTPGQELLLVRIREGSPEEFDAFARALANPALPRVDISFSIAPGIRLGTLMRYIELADAHPRVTGYCFSSPEP